VPEGEHSEVKQILDSFFSELKIADKALDYSVVQNKKGDSSEILRNSVATHHQGKYEIFLIEDKLSARQAVEKGTTPIQKSGLSLDQIQWKTDRS
jgi:K+/H+ antiporter YhaU regulatory subunit KhtT